MKYTCGVFGLLGIVCYWTTLPVADWLMHQVGGHAYVWLILGSLPLTLLSLVEGWYADDRNARNMLGMTVDVLWTGVFLSPYGLPLLVSIYDAASRGTFIR